MGAFLLLLFQALKLLDQFPAARDTFFSGEKSLAKLALKEASVLGGVGFLIGGLYIALIEVGRRQRQSLHDQRMLLREVSERRRIEEDLIRQESQLEELVSQRTSALEEEIAERKRIAQELAEEVIRRRVLFDQSADGIVVIGLEGRVRESNVAFARWIGCAQEEMTQLHIWDWDPQWTRSEILERVRAIPPSGMTFETRHRRKNGTTYDVEVSANRTVVGGEPLLFCVHRDISGRKRAEEALRDREEKERHFAQRLSALHEVGLELSKTQSFDDLCRLAVVLGKERLGFERLGIWFVTKNPEVLTGSFGIDEKGEIRDERGMKLSLAAVEPEWRQILEGRTPCVIHELAPLGDLEGNVAGRGWGAQAALRDGDEIPGIISVDTLLSERPLSEYDLRLLLLFASEIATLSRRKWAEESLIRLGTAIEQLHEVVLITDSRGRIQYVNPAFERTSGYSFAEVRARPPSILKRGKQDNKFYAGLWRTISGGNAWTGVFISKRKDGSLVHEEATISPVFSRDGQIVNYVEVKRDITQELQTEQRLKESQRMEAIGQLSGGIAHDFNNILQIVLVYSQFVLGELAEDSKSRTDLAQVLSAAQRGADLTRQLLAFSRQSALSTAVIDVMPIIKEIVKMVGRTIPSSIKVTFSAAQDLPMIVADATQVHQVLLNLAINARDASPNGGSIHIRAFPAQVTDEQARQTFDAVPGDFVALEVTDTGAGIPEEILPRIFEPFFSTKAPGKGTGLGLASAYGIVKQHGGFIECQSKVGEGTAFRVYIPSHRGEPPTVGEGQGAAPLPHGTERILVADDEDAIATLARRVLENLGYSVVCASNGKEAYEIYLREAEQIALVLLDYQMPEMDGAECLEKIHSAAPAAKVIVASGFLEPEVQARLLELGVGEMLEKPYKSRELAMAIRKVLDA
jgi:PAS domain S-box-containing protein